MRTKQPGEPGSTDGRAVAQAGLVLGPALALIVYLALPEHGAAGALDAAGRATAAIAAWMACWWLTQAVPLAATALLPVVAFPLTGVASFKEAASPYASSLIFLFMGGFIIGLAIQRAGLHRRLALNVLLRGGTSPRRLVGGFMLASALLSMWISNTATAIMMLPIGASILRLLETAEGGRESGPDCTPPAVGAFGTALVLGIAYACSIGGMGTLIGTPPNLVLAAFLKAQYGLDVSMARWLLIGLPLVLVFLPLTWWYLTHLAFRVPATPLPCGREVIVTELRRLGPMSRAEWTVMAVFGATATGWILRPQIAALTGLPGLDDALVAMLGALALFVLPVGGAPGRRAMDWDTAKTLPWDVLILFGGGLSLAAAIAGNGVDRFIASCLTGLAGVPALVMLLAVTGLVVFLTEITSNTAVTTTLLPVLAATAAAMALPPGPLLTAAALAASCAFMLPVATPPNAIVFSSGYVTVGQMARAGLGLNLLAIGLIALLVRFGAHIGPVTAIAP